MEIDGEMPGLFRERSEFSVMEAAALGAQPGECQNQDPENFKGKEEFTVMCRPLKFDGSGGPETLEDFIDSLNEYFSFFPVGVPERKKVYLASRQLEGEARDWWRSVRQGVPQPSNMTIAEFLQALSIRFTPRSFREKLREQLKTLEQNDMPVDLYIAKFQALVRRSQTTNEEFLCEQFLRGLNPRRQTAVADWVSHKRWDGVFIGIEQMIEFARMNEKVNPLQQNLQQFFAKKPYVNPDIEPMDIGAVTTRPHPHQKKQNKKGNDNVKKQPANEKQQRKCFACGKPGHLMKECWFLQKFKEQHAKEQAQKKQAARDAKKKNQGNAQAPTQTAAQ